MENEKILLSICIPTYNGASSFLKDVLEAAVCILSKEDDVEVVVSDNCSTDGTPVLIQKYTRIKNFRSYRNKENVGFNGNFQLLSDKYAEGKYCWFVGDDDVINTEYVSYVLEILRKKEIDLLTLNFNLSTSKKKRHISVEPHYCSYWKAVDLCHDDANTLCTYMGSVVFSRKPFKEFPKDFISNSFDTFYNVFPNAYILGCVFCNSRCAYLGVPVITVLVHNKTWGTDENYYNIISRHFPDLYAHYIKNGAKKDELSITYNSIIVSNLISGYKRLFTFKKVNKMFYKAILLSYRYPSIKVDSIKRIIKIIINKGKR